MPVHRARLIRTELRERSPLQASLMIVRLEKLPHTLLFHCVAAGFDGKPVSDARRLDFVNDLCRTAKIGERNSPRVSLRAFRSFNVYFPEWKHISVKLKYREEMFSMVPIKGKSRKQASV